jgi:ribose transport system substrate-binding protein
MDGRIGVTYVYPTGGAQSIDEAVKILEQGVKPDKTMVLQTEEVTKANAADLFKKYGGK